MKRIELLNQAASTDKTAESTRAKLAQKEKREFEKKVADLKYELSGKKEEFEDRMSSDVQIDYSVVAVSFTAINKLDEQIKTLETFISTYYGN